MRCMPVLPGLSYEAVTEQAIDPARPRTPAGKLTLSALSGSITLFPGLKFAMTGAAAQLPPRKPAFIPSPAGSV
jgi:hypothetical protein